MNIRLIANSKGNTAAKIIQSHLEAAGINVLRGRNILEPYKGTICWGISSPERIALNRSANRYDKYEAMLLFQDAGVQIPDIFLPKDLLRKKNLNGGYILGRNFWHSQGKDIVPYNDIEEAQDRADRHDFFSVFIPTKEEYRVWVFRNQAIAFYNKQFKGDGEYQGFHRNHEEGFHFEFMNRGEFEHAAQAEKMAVKSVKAIDLDFGAVDILKGKDGKLYVLEVNTAPHIDTKKRTSGIKLAEQFKKCIDEGFPARG